MLKHKYLNKLKKNGLFKGVKSFVDIEQQIEEHSDSNKDRGDAFEVFAEAYLTLSINLPYKSVYPENKLTTKHFKRLKITPSETNVRGIDGALVTQSDEFHTYQVKYRSSGDSLSWNELTGSVLASQYADALLIFTNVSDIDDDIAQRNVYSIKIDKLNELTVDDFKRIETLIYDNQIAKKEAITLDPFQDEAVGEVLDKLAFDNRTQLIMPCGSGKTIVGQRIVESIDDAKTILVLVPTLQLLNDTFENYFKDTTWDSFPFICVGSKVVDPRAYDQMDADPSDLPMVTCTDPESVKVFLKKKFNKHIIFSTYQSLPVVADALGKRTVDVAIFDEAHNTASKKGNVWTFGLDDKNIKIKKRIFMTATPRKYQLRRKNEDDMRIVFSMDNPNIYGDVAYKLSFKKAADEYGVICRYKIIISVITSKYYTRKDLRDGDVLVGYSDVNAENIAKQIALQDAVKKNTINKIISFHPTIAHSENFVGEKEISIKHRLKDFDLYNVSSKKKMGIRRSTMSAFRKADTALISNAQCLTEGIDVPAVDMVAFMSPKKSKVSIVQAVGRAIRKPRGSDKEWGYVFVPIFLEKASGETDVEAAERSSFKDMYEVINALRDHDEVLDDVIKNLRTEKGNKGKFNGKVLDDYIQIIGVDLSIKNLEKHIQSEIVEKMSQTWYYFYGKLLKYKERFGDCIVPQGWEEDPSLGTWVANARRRYNELNDDQIEKFNAIEFIWDPLDYRWMKMYEDLKQFKKAYNHTIVPDKWENNRRLATWVGVQRRNRNTLSEEYKKLLDDIDFDYDPLQTIWNEKFERLKTFKQEHGHCLVTQRYEKDQELAHFVVANRNSYKQSTLDPKNKKLLDDIGFDWNPDESTWFNFYDQLKDYYIENKHSDIPWNEYDDKSLVSWMSKQKGKRKSGNLSEERIELLDELNFSWNTKEIKWNEMYRQLVEYYKIHGHSNVIKKKGDQLSNWVGVQRNNFRKGIYLSKERIEKLKKVQFVFNPHDEYWEKRYEKFVKYVKNNGHHKVRIDENKKLFNWIRQQLIDYRNGNLKESRKKLLIEHGFKFTKVEEHIIVGWQNQYNELKEFVKKNGNAWVKRGYKNKQLFTWVGEQRTKYKNKKLKQEYIDLLNDVGFIWDAHQQKWEESLDALVQFKKKYGHLKPDYKTHNNMVGWINNQRLLKRKGVLSQLRIDMLNEIGFEWEEIKAKK